LVWPFFLSVPFAFLKGRVWVCVNRREPVCVRVDRARIKSSEPERERE